MTQFALAIQGKLADFMAAEAEALRVARDKAVKGATEDIKNAVRGAVGRALRRRGRGPDFRKSVRAKYFRDPDGLTGLVYSKFGRRGRGGKFEDFLLPHMLGATTTPKRAKVLFVVVDPRLRRKFRARSADARSAKVREFFATQKGLKIIPTGRPGVSVVVKQTRTRSRIFGYFMRQVRIPKRLDIRPIIARYERDFPGRLVAEINAASTRI